MKVYGITHRGKIRSENQDSFRYRLLEDGGVLMVLCDGMGGARAGALASATAAAAFMSHAGLCLQEERPPEPAVILREAASFANLQVYDRAARDESCAGMGTTMVAGLIRENECTLLNVGDSRAYLLSGGELRQVSRDHSLVAELLARHAISPEEARSHPQKNVITRAVGVDYKLKSDIFTPELGSGDRLLFCSDGLSNMVRPEEIARVLREEPEEETACGTLLQMALDAGAPDNVTILLLSR